MHSYITSKEHKHSYFITPYFSDSMEIKFELVVTFFLRQFILDNLHYLGVNIFTLIKFVKNHDFDEII